MMMMIFHVWACVSVCGGEPDLHVCVCEARRGDQVCLMHKPVAPLSPGPADHINQSLGADTVILPKQFVACKLVGGMLSTVREHSDEPSIVDN